MLSASMGWLLYLSVLVTVACLAVLAYRSLHAAGCDDPSGMVGQSGTAQGTFTQEGVVLARGELWRATSDGGIIQKGDSVVIREVRPGLVLVVSKLQR